jgi:rare lipoprotein A (peptidoglycan hydrolase)
MSLTSRMPWVICAALWISGCSSYSAANVASRPAPQPEHAQPPRAPHVTVASWYGPGFIGQRTASGEIYHRNDLTAASRSLPLGTRVQVTNLNTGRSVVVKINDRGPYVRGRGIDLSERAAERIGLNHSGVARVSVTRLDQAATASAASDSAPIPDRWSGAARITHYTPHTIYHAPRYYHRTRHHYTHHYSYASSHYSSHRMVANPVGDWLLQMVR